jgi:hypothetical protein
MVIFNYTLSAAPALDQKPENKATEFQRNEGNLN